MTPFMTGLRWSILYFSSECRQWYKNLHASSIFEIILEAERGKNGEIMEKVKVSIKTFDSSDYSWEWLSIRSTEKPLRNCRFYFRITEKKVKAGIYWHYHCWLVVTLKALLTYNSCLYSFDIDFYAIGENVQAHRSTKMLMHTCCGLLVSRMWLYTAAVLSHEGQGTWPNSWYRLSLEAKDKAVLKEGKFIRSFKLFLQFFNHKVSIYLIPTYTRWVEWKLWEKYIKKCREDLDTDAIKCGSK